jgi:hypothetical protein
VARHNDQSLLTAHAPEAAGSLRSRPNEQDVSAEKVAMIDRTMIGMTRPTSANAVQLGGRPKKPPR